MASQECAEVDGGLLEVRPSLFAHIEEGLKKNPHGLATISMHQSAEHLSHLVAEPKDGQSDQVKQHGCLQWTYSQIHKAAMKFAGALLAQNIRPGMRIVTLFPNRVEWPLTLWMTTIMRLTLCSLDPGMLNLPRREELVSLMTTLQPDVVMVLDQDGAQAIEEVFSRNFPTDIRPPKLKILLEPDAESKTTDWVSFSKFAAKTFLSLQDGKKLLQEALNDDPNRHALIVFTSGTSSGQPKGCPRHVLSICHGLNSQVYGVRGFHQKSHILQSSANFRIIAPSVTLHAWRTGAATVIPDPTLGARGTIAAIREHRITFILFIPALLHAFVAESEFQAGELDVSCIEDVQLGGEIMTGDIFNKAARAFPTARICNGHGMSEGGGMFKWPFDGLPCSEIPYINDICPLGKVAPGARLRIQDPEDPKGKVLKRGEIGEFVCSCESIIKSYLDDGHQDSFFTDPKTGIRWFRTGDLGIIDPDEVVYIVGRAKDRIKRSGIPILPAALENCIEKFTGAQTVVVANPHPILGQEPLAVVRDFNGKSEGEIQEHVISLFGKDYTLGPVLSLEQLGLDKFPLNATGKVMKAEVLKKAQDHLSSKS